MMSLLFPSRTFSQFVEILCPLVVYRTWEAILFSSHKINKILNLLGGHSYTQRWRGLGGGGGGGGGGGE